MSRLLPIQCAAVALVLFLATFAWADDRETVLAKLKANKVSLGGLTIESKDGGAAINLGTGLDGGEANNATDANLRLIAQLPEIERVMVYKGKVTADGLAALTALPKLRYLQMYETDVPAAAFAVLPKLTQLKSLSLGNYPLTDEVIGYVGQIKGLKSFGHTQSVMTPAGFLKFLNSVESLEQLTLFGDYIDDACMKRIGQMKEMKRFWTDSKKVTAAGWVHLAGLIKMRDLFLSNTNFGDNDMRALEGMKELQSLGLNKTRITDAGMPSLAGLTKLRDLGLDGTNITDKGMSALKGMTELDNLYVGMTDVTAKGLAMVPRKERMQMMRVGKGAMTAKQLDEMIQLYPKTQIIDPSGYWTPERVKAAMKELGKDVPGWKKDVDSIEGRKVEAASQKRWRAVRDQDPAAYNTLVHDAQFNRTGPDVKRRDYSAVVFETLNDPKKKLDAVTVSEQIIAILGGETAIETGRAVGTKKDLKEPVWEVLYTATWVRKDGKWWVVNEHQTPVKQAATGDKFQAVPPKAKLPTLPGKAPVFALVSKVNKGSETMNFFLLFDEIVNTEKIVEDENGIVKKRTADRVMTGLYQEKMERSIKGSVVSTGEGKIIPRKQAMEELPGKLVIICDDFEGLHPTYRKMLAKETWILEIEKPKGLRVESPLERLEALKARQGVAATLFLEIKNADQAGILATLEANPEQAGEKYQKFVADLKQRIDWLNHTDREHVPPSIGELSLVMLAALDPRLPKDPVVDLDLAYRCIHQSFKQLEGEPKPRAELLRELLKAWMKARMAGAREYAWMAKQYGLRELASELVNVVLDPKMDAVVRFNHLWPLANLGSDSEISALCPLLENTGLIPNGPQPIPLALTDTQAPQEWRDVVLGVLVRISGEKMADFGFKRPNDGSMPVNPGIDFVFKDNETRQKALAKWKSRNK